MREDYPLLLTIKAQEFRRGELTQTHTQPAMTCLLPQPLKTGKYFEESLLQKILRNLINVSRVQIYVCLCVCMGHVCLWVCAHAAKECTVCVGYKCTIKHVFMCAQVASQLYTHAFPLLWHCSVLSRCVGGRFR